MRRWGRWVLSPPRAQAPGWEPLQQARVSPRGALVSRHARRGSARNPACFSLVSSSYLLTPDSSRQASPRRYEKPSVGNLQSNCLTSPPLRRLPTDAGYLVLRLKYIRQILPVLSIVML